MKLLKNVASLFSNNSNKNKNKKGRGKKSSPPLSKSNPPSFGSAASSSSSSSSLPLSPNSVLHPSASDLFSIFDRDRDGKITKSELEAVFRQLGAGPLTDDEVASMVAEIDRDGDGCISLEELSAVELGGDGDVGAEGMRDAFGVFDADGDGNISAGELMGVFVALGVEECTIEECERMIKGVDSNGDGFVCFRDFVRMMQRR